MDNKKYLQVEIENGMNTILIDIVQKNTFPIGSENLERFVYLNSEYLESSIYEALERDTDIPLIRLQLHESSVYTILESILIDVSKLHTDRLNNSITRKVKELSITLSEILEVPV